MVTAVMPSSKNVDQECPSSQISRALLPSTLRDLSALMAGPGGLQGYVEDHGSTMSCLSVISSITCKASSALTHCASMPWASQMAEA